MNSSGIQVRNRDALGVLEVTGLGPALVILDHLEKAADVRLLQAELNDYYGFVMKVVGDAANVQMAVEAGRGIADQMHAACVTDVIEAPDREVWKAIVSPREFQPLIVQDVVHTPGRVTFAAPATPATPATPVAQKEDDMSEPNAPFAIGLIETQGFTAVIEAIDTACKAADVEVMGKEKLGGGYITILIKGDVAAVKAAIAAGREAVDGLGKLIAAHVIAQAQ